MSMLYQNCGIAALHMLKNKITAFCNATSLFSTASPLTVAR